MLSYFLRSLPSSRRKQSSAAQPCFHKHVDHGLAIAAAGKGCRLSRPLKKPDAALLFVIIASVKIPPLVPLCLILPLLLPRPPPAPKATMWFTAKCHTRFSRCRKRPFFPHSSTHTLTLHTPSPFQKKESEKCSHLNVNELLLSTDQVISAPPPRGPPSLPPLFTIVEVHLISATNLRGWQNNFATYRCHRLPPSLKLFFAIHCAFSSQPLSPSSSPPSRAVVIHMVHSYDEKPISISHKFPPNSIAVRVLPCRPSRPASCAPPPPPQSLHQQVRSKGRASTLKWPNEFGSHNFARPFPSPSLLLQTWHVWWSTYGFLGGGGGGHGNNGVDI